MADHPVKSVVLPKRLHRFLAYHQADPILDATTREYHQIIEVFHPKLALPLTLGKGLVIQIFQLIVLPFLRRQKSFEEETCILSYISINAHPENETPYPTRSLVLPQNLVKFISIVDDPETEATAEEYHKIIVIFFPQLELPRSINRETLITIFNIMVLPFLHRLDEWDEDRGYIRFCTVEVLPQTRPKAIPIQSVTLPVSLHSFLAFTDPNISVIAGPTNQHILQIIEIFHPHVNGLFKPDDSCVHYAFDKMVLPYLRNVLSFNSQNNKLTYYAVDINDQFQGEFIFISQLSS